MIDQDAGAPSGYDAPYREYRCLNCGRFLFATNIPLGTPGHIRTPCPTSDCHRLNSPRAGADPPRSRNTRAEWLARRRPRAVDTAKLRLS